jgi:hypothetical protein
MRKTIGLNEFAEGFKVFGLGNYFSNNGLVALFEYLKKLEDETGEEFEYSPVDLCCDYAEYSSLTQAADEYGISTEALRDKTNVIEFEGGVIILAFLR